MVSGVTFHGGRQLERALLELSQKEAKKVGRRAVRVAAKPILDDAKANVPVDKGRLKRALQLRVDTLRGNRSVMSALINIKFRGDYRPTKTARARYSYQIGSEPKVYGYMVEFGLGPHAPVPQPFLRPAWDAQGGQTALNRLGKELGEGLERAARQLGGKL